MHPAGHLCSCAWATGDHGDAVESQHRRTSAGRHGPVLGEEESNGQTGGQPHLSPFPERHAGGHSSVNYKSKGAQRKLVISYCQLSGHDDSDETLRAGHMQGLTLTLPTSKWIVCCCGSWWILVFLCRFPTCVYAETRTKMNKRQRFFKQTTLALRELWYKWVELTWKCSFSGWQQLQEL